jgi:polyhydroxyalkanoate synthesis repressor PhaR
VAKRANEKTPPKVTAARAATGSARDPQKPRRRGRPPRRETVTPDLPGVRVIKRYGNRRLYDHSLSRAVTMDDLAAAVQNGEDLRVFDGDSGDDVTRRVLLQILLEQQNEAQLDLFPIEFLRLFIQLRGEPTGKFLSQYLDAGAEWMSRHLSQAGSGSTLRTVQESLETMFPWLGTAGTARRESARREPPSTPTPSAKTPPDKGADLADEILDLQSKLADLAKRVTRR